MTTYCGRAPLVGSLFVLVALGISAVHGQVVELVSVSKDDAGDGTATASHVSADPCISADGRYVAFASFAHDLVAGVPSGRIHDLYEDQLTLPAIYIRDTTAKTTTAIVAEDGSWPAYESVAPSISSTDDAIRVAFLSRSVWEPPTWTKSGIYQLLLYKQTQTSNSIVMINDPK